MALPWVRFDTSFPQHDKVLELIAARGGREAGFVYVCGLAYVGAAQSDGLIPFSALPFLHGTRRHADLLIAHGMWKPHPKGWEIVNYLERQPSSRVVREARQTRSVAGRKAACARWHPSGCRCWAQVTA